MKKTIHVGTIRGIDILLKTPKGHQLNAVGCGVHTQGEKRYRTRASQNRRAIREQV